jgi:hypothetical protein
VKTKQGKKKIDLKRAKGVTPKNIKELFEVLSGPLLRDVRAQHRYNMDETGIMERVGFNGRHVEVSEKLSWKRER